MPQVEVAFARQAPALERVLEVRAAPLTLAVAELDRHHAISGNRTDQVVVGRAAEVMPGVQDHAAFWRSEAFAICHARPASAVSVQGRNSKPDQQAMI